ncbi:hypothetical protein B9Z55_025695 [Caenorhabditis nigoni]|uniref:Uncharacterized protein n=1 Tax=Caenorhabditis nigoni TaxID=1611254 RepID=A0A2G5SZX9_9PELO|nr:hypothetical protein B9Z55_025695 [Caenorhabditis nigoni]
MLPCNLRTLLTISSDLQFLASIDFNVSRRQSRHGPFGNLPSLSALWSNDFFDKSRGAGLVILRNELELTHVCRADRRRFQDDSGKKSEISLEIAGNGPKES